MKKVVILQHRLLHYRTGLFELLRSRCAASDIDLVLIHGQPVAQEIEKHDVGSLDWATRVHNLSLTIRGKSLLWQPFPKQHRDASLVILMQENRIISNYRFLLGAMVRGGKVAYWGHGRNFQSMEPSGIRERWKRLWLNCPDWWFAYTQLTKDVLVQSGFDRARISVLNNAIDNDGFSRDLSEIGDARLNQLKAEYKIAPNDRVGLFCGSLYPEKRLDYLLAAADIIQARLPGFKLIVIGDGPSRAKLESLRVGREWLRVVGSKRGKEKAELFRIADVVLNPGLVGLHILDAFCAALPMITTSDAAHSPEIAYLEDDRNGKIVVGDVVQYAKSVHDLLSNSDKYLAMCQAAKLSAKSFTLEAMVDNFIDGMAACMKSA